MKKISKALITLFFLLMMVSTTFLPASAAAAPAQVTGVKVSAVTYNSASLSWSKAKNANKYYIEKYDTSAKKWKALANTTKTSYALTKLTTGTTYQYRIRAYRNLGKVYGKYSATVSVKPVPVKVTGLKASSITPISAKLTWTKVAGATGYVVQTYKAADKKWVTLKKVTTNSYALTGLTPNSTLNYKVAAYKTVSKKDIMGAYSSSLSVKTTVAQVTGLKATQTSPVQVTLTWTKVTGATSYEVYQDGKKITTVTKNTASVKNLVPNTTYKYTVKAIVTVSKKNYAGAVSSAVSIKPAIGQVKGLKAATVKNTSVKLSWTKLDSAEGYTVYNGSKIVTTITNKDTVAYTVSKLTAGTSYKFKVVPYYGSYTGTASSTITVVTLCDAPKNLISEEVLKNSIEVSWSAVSKASKYVVYLNSKKMLETKETNVVFSKLTENTDYTIDVVAVNSASAESAKATIKEKTPTLDISIRDVSVTNYIPDTETETYRILWYACAKQGDEVYRYRVTDNFTEGSKDLDFIMHNVQTKSKAFEIDVSEDAEGYATIKWPAISGARYYEVQVSSGEPGKNSWATIAATRDTSLKTVLAPSSELDIRVVAIDRTITITAYDTQLQQDGTYVLTTPHTGKRAVHLAGSVSANFHIKTNAADITKTDNMSKTKAVLSVVQAVNNTKNEQDYVNVSGSKKMTAKMESTAVTYQQWMFGWVDRSTSLGEFLKLVGGSDMFDDLLTDLDEDQTFNLRFTNGKGQGTITDADKTQTSYGVDLNSLIVPSDTNAFLYNAGDIKNIDSKITNLKVIPQADGTTKIEFKIKKETATPSNPMTPVHTGLYDSMADSMDSMAELSDKSKIEIGDTTYSAVINANGTLDKLDISSAFNFVMAMSMTDEVESGSLLFRNIGVSVTMKGVSSANYVFSDR